MTRTARFATAIAALALSTTVAGTIAYGRDDAEPPSQQLQYYVHFSPFTLVDVGAKGPSRGDQIVSSDQIFAQSGTKVGRDTQACGITKLSPLEAECTLTFVFADGTITAQYMGRQSPHKIAAVTGGTGKYIGARGQMTLVESGHDNSPHNVLTFRLLG
jgi:hypothetical protein